MLDRHLDNSNPTDKKSYPMIKGCYLISQNPEFQNAPDTQVFGVPKVYQVALRSDNDKLVKTIFLV
jgi:hypothetical protein